MNMVVRLNLLLYETRILNQSMNCEYFRINFIRCADREWRQQTQVYHFFFWICLFHNSGNVRRYTIHVVAHWSPIFFFVFVNDLRFIPNFGFILHAFIASNLHIVVVAMRTIGSTYTSNSDDTHKQYIDCVRRLNFLRLLPFRFCSFFFAC